jgi:hypothetical protein
VIIDGSITVDADRDILVDSPGTIEGAGGDNHDLTLRAGGTVFVQGWVGGGGLRHLTIDRRRLSAFRP